MMNVCNYRRCRQDAESGATSRIENPAGLWWFTFFTDRMKSRLQLDHTHANVLEIENGKLTGKVVGGIVDADEKKRTVERVCAEMGITPDQAIVMGDGANDLKMMKISGMSVAFRAKPVVRAQADVALNFVGLDGVLNLF
jgi:phosphoserine phosphatase